MNVIECIFIILRSALFAFIGLPLIGVILVILFHACLFAMHLIFDFWYQVFSRYGVKGTMIIRAISMDITTACVDWYDCHLKGKDK